MVTGGTSMDEALRLEIEGLRKLKTKALKERYREVFGETSPSGNHAHLYRRVAWRLQALAEGELSQRARERAAQLAEDADVRLRAPRQFWGKLDRAREAASVRRDRRLPTAGSLLKRSYRGHSIVVKVLGRLGRRSIHVQQASE